MNTFKDGENYKTINLIIHILASASIEYSNQGAMIAQSAYCWATGWTIWVLGFDSWWGLGIFLFTTMSRMDLEPTQPPIQWVPGALSLGAKRPGRETDHSTPSSSKVKELVELYLHSPIRLHGVVLS
jgi:hypothetical protein